MEKELQKLGREEKKINFGGVKDFGKSTTCANIKAKQRRNRTMRHVRSAGLVCKQKKNVFSTKRSH